jgi:YjbE family integral membrane protein
MIAVESAHFLISGLSIILIDLLLAGDNALVIAMAVRSLPKRERRIGIVAGAGTAVILRVGLTFFASKILSLEYVQLAGGIFILWIALRVMVDASDPPEVVPATPRLLQAIWFIVVADLTMSFDNILAIAGASHGHFGLILFGLALSIPFVIFSSNLLASLMDRYPLMIYFGAAILAKVGGDMVLGDGFVERLVHPSDVVRYVADATLIIALLVVGKAIAESRHAARTRHASGDDSKVRYQL